MKTKRFVPLACALLLGVAQAATAQEEMPAVSNSPASPAAPAAQPAVKPSAVAPAAAKGDGKGNGGGTTIFGERESPIGLYITPWRDARPEQDIDRPARLLQDKMLPIDRAVFNREIQYYEALSAELKRKGLITPAAR